MEKKIYYNGNIITMEADVYTPAVLTDGGRIVATGALEDMKMLAKEARLVDLCGKTMLPAFIDAHGHFSACANAMLQCSIENAGSFEEMIHTITRYIEENHIPKGQWVLVRDYDQSVLKEQHKPDRYVLDRISTNHPMIVQHKSGHVGILNSLALERLGLDASVCDPEGGRFERRDGELTGYLEENAFMQVLHRLPVPGFEALADAYERVQKMYAANGITTVQEGMMVRELVPLYEFLCHEHRLWLDVVGYPAMDCQEEIYKTFAAHDGKYEEHFKLGGCKIFLDGSPQSRTAWMRTPYVKRTDGGLQAQNTAGRLAAASRDCSTAASGAEEYGYPTQTLKAVTDSVSAAVSHGRQILAHCNGDAAAQQFLDAIALANERLAQDGFGGRLAADVRPVMIHAQLLGRDQLPQLRALGVIPSFFIAHVYYWGDTHIQNFGLSRAAAISPAYSAGQAGLLYTFHQDSPVIRPNMLETIWCAVCRETRNGVVLGEDERISVMDALKAVTINSAWQYFEEDAKGSIAPGKWADFVILDENPLTIDPRLLRNIQILATIKAGTCIYKVTAHK